MSVLFHKAEGDTGGAIGVEIGSGSVGVLFPTISEANLTDGEIIYRKLYLKSDRDETGSIALAESLPFDAILFEGSGDAQVVGDLTGSEVDGSPISFDLPSGTHSSYWIKLTIPALWTGTETHIKIDLDITY